MLVREIFLTSGLLITYTVTDLPISMAGRHRVEGECFDPGENILNFDRSSAGRGDN